MIPGSASPGLDLTDTGEQAEPLASGTSSRSTAGGLTLTLTHAVITAVTMSQHVHPQCHHQVVPLVHGWAGGPRFCSRWMECSAEPPDRRRQSILGCYGGKHVALMSMETEAELQPNQCVWSPTHQGVDLFIDLNDSGNTGKHASGPLGGSLPAVLHSCEAWRYPGTRHRAVVHMFCRWKNTPEHSPPIHSVVHYYDPAFCYCLVDAATQRMGPF